MTIRLVQSAAVAAATVLLAACGDAAATSISTEECAATTIPAVQEASDRPWGGATWDHTPTAQCTTEVDDATKEPEALLATADTTALPLGDEPAGAVTEIVESVAWDDPVIQITDADVARLGEMRELPGLLHEAPPAPGATLGRIVIPKADVDWVVVEGITADDLRNGPGHVRGSAMPGQVGNTVIAGHRTTNGAPFYYLDRLSRGDTISVESSIGTHTYEVVESRVVLPSDTWIATQWDDNSWLTLTACTPRFSSSHRLVVFSRLIDGPNADAIQAIYGPPLYWRH